MLSHQNTPNKPVQLATILFDTLSQIAGMLKPSRRMLILFQPLRIQSHCAKHSLVRSKHEIAPAHRPRTAFQRKNTPKNFFGHYGDANPAILDGHPSPRGFSCSKRFLGPVGIFCGSRLRLLCFVLFPLSDLLWIVLRKIGSALWLWLGRFHAPIATNPRRGVG